jgi:serine/threonine protein kinase
LHLDVKPENILLNEDYHAIVGDFGLSKLMCKDQSRIVTSIRGTKGYLAPEWLLQHGVSEKSDVYSYGMVLLEMIGGRRNVNLVDNGLNDRKWEYFPKIVYEKMRNGKFKEIVDERLLGVDENEVKKLVYVAMWCIQEKARLRPNMSLVVDMLEGRVPVDEPPETSMIVVDLLSIDDDIPKDRERLGTVALAAQRELNNVPSIGSCTLSIVSPR